MTSSALVSVCWLAFTAAPPAGPPRLGVMVVIDQLPASELEALALGGGETDFGGFEARGAARFDAWYSYLGTETGPGHATLSTSSNPSTHGICANTWWVEGKPMYCVDDPGSQTLGAPSGMGRSARFLLSPTLGDTLKARNPKSKVVSISVKDRSAILMGGNSSDVAIWYDQTIGRFTTSKNWGAALPEWAQKLSDLPVRAFNTARWSPLPAVGKRGLEDAREGEDSPDGFTTTFPHDLSTLPDAQKMRAYRLTPSSLEDTFALATAALDGEQLGKRGEPDLLLVSISATDYAGHAWGPGSVEKVDMLERTSLELKKFTAELDKKVGKNNWALVLSSDHGAAPLAEAVQKQRIVAGRMLEERLIQDATFGMGPELRKRLLGLSPPVIFLDTKGMKDGDRDAFIDAVRKNLSALRGVRKAFRVDQRDPDDALARASTYPDRCGPVFVELQPYFVFTETPHPLGTDHASGNAYDRRVPLFVIGPQIVPGRSASLVDPRDASPTLAAMLQIPPPDRSEGRPVPAFKR